jgi:hypothetical protein
MPCHHTQALQAQLQRFQQKGNTSNSSSSLQAAAAAAPALVSAEQAPVPVSQIVAESRAITIAR